MKQSITVAELKAAEWRFTMHADGRGFSINFYECKAFGVKGWRRHDRNPPRTTAGYAIGEIQASTLVEVAEILNRG